MLPSSTTQEPVGLIATEDIRALTRSLRGDLVIGINGRTATAAALAEGDALLYLDVLRGATRLVVIRVEVKLDAREVVVPRADVSNPGRSTRGSPVAI